MENKEFSFWNLISEYTIEIPAIQRDYVQDRLYSDLQKADCDIVGDIEKSLRSQTKINLHFVYGKVDNQELIPLDGQQRLTTLFLLHWFLSLGTLSDKKSEILSKFTYETRPSSEDFCRKLVKESIEYNTEQKISEQITNTKWFFLSWKSDPTIKAMLNMLDVIQQKFKKPNEDLFNLLCSDNCPVIFHFLPLEQFKLDDEIYVKMNSRGKPLTDFENFKANFSVLFNQDDKSKLDNEWLDIFWKFEKDNQQINLKEVDRKYLKFIENISLCFWAESKDISKDEKDNFVLFNRYKEIYSSEYLNFLSKIFDALTTYKDTKKYFEDFLTSNPDYWEYLRFYAVAQFFIHCGNVNNTNLETYNKWVRVSRNLINNSLIQAPDEFYKAIRSIKDLAKNIQNIYEYLIVPETKIVGFLKNQVEEEKTKAELILNDNSDKWNEVIEITENHSYFNGQIGFILDYAKTNNVYDIDKFSDYSEKLSKLFSLEFQGNHDCLLQRALLTYGDYLPAISGHYTFCNFENSLRAKMDNWRKVFNDETKSSYLKQLLDNVDVNNIKDGLQKIINNFIEDNTDWKSLLIKNKGIIEYCINYQIDKRNNNIYLARSSANAWKRKAELASYVFYKTKLESKESNFSPFQRVWYWDTADGEPCAVVDNWIYRKYYFALDIRYLGCKFSLSFYDRNGHNLPNEVIEKLEDLSFTKNVEKIEDLVKDTEIEITKSCTCLIDNNIDFTKVENKIKELVNTRNILENSQL